LGAEVNTVRVGAIAEVLFAEHRRRNHEPFHFKLGDCCTFIVSKVLEPFLVSGLLLFLEDRLLGGPWSRGWGVAARKHEH